MDLGVMAMGTYEAKRPTLTASTVYYHSTDLLSAKEHVTGVDR